MTPEQNKETKHEKMKEKVENIQTEKKKRCDEEKCDCKEQISPEEEKKTVSMTMEEFDAIKLQMAKILNDEKDLEKDFENYRKRSREEVEKSFIDGQTKALESILPALDSFKKAKKMISDEKSLEGINMIEKNIMQALEKLGVKKIKAVGVKFDPNMHNAILSVADDKIKTGFIIDETESGYTLGDKVIKYSQVVVAK
jgi:molecular chaperone GrpE